MVDFVDVGGVLLALFLVVMNGVFVAAEFAFVKVRPTQVNALVERGKPGAKAVQGAVENLDSYLAVSQLGITLSSLGLGWVGEPALAALIDPVLGQVLPASLVHLVAFAVGFGTITFLHVVFGELAPKTFAIQEAVKVALVVAPLMKVFHFVFRPGLVVFNGTANYFTRLAGVSPASESEETHTEEEIRMILTRSEETGEIDVDEVEMIESVFDLEETVAREVMIPRPDVATVPGSMGLPELRGLVVEGAYTRYVVLDDDGEQAVGFVHAKDVLHATETEPDRGDSLTARDLAREAIVVPETRRIDAILGDFQSAEGSQLAVVVDEWGVFEGILTIEDVLEEIVGDIRDEFDTEAQQPGIAARDDGTYLVDGGVPVRDVNDRLDTGFESSEVETIGGLVFSRLGRVPEVGDELEHDGFLLRVEAVTDARIDRLVVRPPERAATGGTDAAGVADSGDETDSGGGEE